MSLSDKDYSLSQAKVANSIGTRLASLLPMTTEHPVSVTEPRLLLRPSRFDVAAKVIYAQERVLGEVSVWAMHVYVEHIRAFNGFHEADGSKHCKVDFVQHFDNVIQSIKEHGFHSDGLVPVDRNQTIIDGGHRLATCLALNEPIQLVHFDQYQNLVYDYRYFEGRGLGREICNAVALQYCRMAADARVAVVFPISKQPIDPFLERVNKFEHAIIDRACVFSELGRANLIRLLYEGESWVGDGVEPTRGLVQHVDRRFRGTEPVRFIFFESTDGLALTQAKAEYRALAGNENYSIHVTDTQAETIRIAEAVLSVNGLGLLNLKQPVRTPRFDMLTSRFKTQLAKSDLPIAQCCLVGSAAMAAHGLRDVGDLDYVHRFAEKGPEDNEISCENEAIGEDTIGELINDPRQHVVVNGLKIASLDFVVQKKLERHHPKDRLDIEMIQACLDGRHRIRQPAIELQIALHRTRHRLVRWLKRWLPPTIISLLNTVYGAADRLLQAMRKKF